MECQPRCQRASVLLIAALLVLVSHGIPAISLAHSSTPPAVADQFDVPMLGGNPAHSGSQPGPGPGDAPNVTWTFDTRAAISTDPVLAAGIIYLGTQDGDLWAIEAATGEMRWHAEMLGSVQTPAVVNGTVFASSLRSLVGFDAVTGEPRWQFEADHILSAPTVANDLVFVGSWGGVVTAIETATGVPRWSASTDESVPLTSPAVAAGSVYVVSEGKSLYAFEADTGVRHWRIQMDGSTSSPALANGVAYVGVSSEDEQGELAAIDAATGDTRWRVAVGQGCCTRPAVTGDLVYVGVSGEIVALDALSGGERWRWESGGYLVAAPVVTADGVYVGSWQTFAANSRAGFLHALDAETGHDRWRFAAGDWITMTPVVANGAIYVGSWDAQLVALTGEPS